ncbi:MAG: hypothetical protein R8G66_24910 [Cytophagales bacterium]|nr:hypothetical protein [Cytophagales bacterium]
MRIEFSKQLPSIPELTAILKDRFSEKYSVRTYGAGKQSIIVGKSTLVGAQISVDKNELSIHWTPPSAFGSLLMFLGMTELAILFLPFMFKEGIGYPAHSNILQKEIGLFLKQKLS